MAPSELRHDEAPEPPRASAATAGRPAPGASAVRRRREHALGAELADALLVPEGLRGTLAGDAAVQALVLPRVLAAAARGERVAAWIDLPADAARRRAGSRSTPGATPGATVDATRGEAIGGTIGATRGASELAGADADAARAGPPHARAERVYLKGSPLGARPRLRHRLRELALRLPPPRLAERANLLWLRERGFRAPEPLAAGALRDALGAPTYQYLATAEVAGAARLDAALARAAPDARAACLRALAGDVARLHALGFVHRDLHPRNVLVQGDPARGETWLVDAWRGGARRQSRGPAWDLACLLAPELVLEEERELVLEAYLAGRARAGLPVAPLRLRAAVARELRAVRRREARAARG